MLNLSNSSDCDDESMIVARFLDFNGNQTNENAHVEMLIDGSVRIRNKLKNRLLDLADKLDAEKAKHAEEMAFYRLKSKEKREELKHNVYVMEQLIHELNEDNDVKIASNRQAKEFFQTIYDRKKTHTHITQ